LGHSALVLTVSDGVNAGVREDGSGAALETLLASAGFEVSRQVTADEVDDIGSILRASIGEHDLIVTTGGTGFGPRDVTPEATARVIQREAPGLTHLMLQAGIKNTPMAALSRARAGSAANTLIINVPGSPKGATESLEALLDVIPHALALLGGDTEHR
jgi:molybdenum cofactor synthesis domain-containing protein